MSAPRTTLAPVSAVTRPATAADVPAVARIFGRAFDDYRRGFGVDAATLGTLWEESLAARVEATTVAVVPSPAAGEAETVVGFVITVKPGARERYRRRRSAVNRRGASWWRVLGPWRIWRLPAFFLPMGAAYARRKQARDELYISLIAVDPDHQGQGIGRALLAAAEAEARAAGAVAVLLHTASTNTTARAVYARAGYVLVCAVRAPWPGPAGIPVYLALRKPLGPEPAPRIEALTR
ncbi:MAG TPA: GNAT family N-acetyltransferase [Chloroflexota bacterium]|nr:GNAT family N-acetyltransferase [Chloroflexota bacterium]